MIEGNCLLMLEWTATGILAFLLGLAGAGFYVRTVRRPTDRSGTHRRLRWVVEHAGVRLRGDARGGDGGVGLILIEIVSRPGTVQGMHVPGCGRQTDGATAMTTSPARQPRCGCHAALSCTKAAVALSS
jgi:hypothetical protein